MSKAQKQELAAVYTTSALRLYPVFSKETVAGPHLRFPLLRVISTAIGLVTTALWSSQPSMLLCHGSIMTVRLRQRKPLAIVNHV